MEQQINPVQGSALQGAGNQQQSGANLQQQSASTVYQQTGSLQNETLGADAYKSFEGLKVESSGQIPASQVVATSNSSASPPVIGGLLLLVITVGIIAFVVRTKKPTKTEDVSAEGEKLDPILEELKQGIVSKKKKNKLAKLKKKSSGAKKRKR